MRYSKLNDTERYIFLKMCETFGFTFDGNDMVTCHCGKRMYLHATGQINERMITHSQGHKTQDKR